MSHRLNKTLLHIKESSEQFLFSLENDVLSTEQRHQYDRDGFIVIPGLLNDEDITKYMNRFKDICSMPPEEVKKLPFLVMRDVSISKSEFRNGEKSVTKLQDWHDDPVLFDFCKHPKILKYVQCFCGPNVKSIHTMLINKPPDTGAGTSRHPMHQDLHYFPMRPADRIVCAWAAMEKINAANGCLTVIPGSHREYPLLPHSYPEWEGGVNKLYHGVTIPDKVLDKRIHVEMEKGDVVLFHPLLLHGSGMNRTNGFRKAISCHYASSNCFTINVMQTSQESLAEEIFETYKKRAEAMGMKDLDNLPMEVKQELFVKFWKAKSRLVCGKEVSY